MRITIDPTDEIDILLQFSARNLSAATINVQFHYISISVYIHNIVEFTLCILDTMLKPRENLDHEQLAAMPLTQTLLYILAGMPNSLIY